MPKKTVPIDAEFQQQFTIYSKYGNPQSDGRKINAVNCDRWFRQAKLIDGKRLTSDHVNCLFRKFHCSKLPIDAFLEYVKSVAAAKKMTTNLIMEKLTKCGIPESNQMSVSLNLQEYIPEDYYDYDYFVD